MFNRELVESLQYKEELWLITFCNYIDLTGNCWLWKGAIGHDGRTVFNYNNKGVSAPKLAYNIANDYDPDFIHPYGVVVMHSCDTPTCVNPDHLKLGTHKDNQRDSIKKGRREKHYPITLNFELAERIRDEYDGGRGGFTQKQLAKKYNVSLRQMQNVLTNKAWITNQNYRRKDTHQILLNGEELPLTLTEYAVLQVLKAVPNQVVSLEQIKKKSGKSDPRSIIFRLRRKLGNNYITTVRGRGYAFNF